MAFDQPSLKTADELSEKQREVLDLLLDRRTNKEIAAILGVSASAVEQRLQSIRRRMGVTSRAEIARTYAFLLEACQFRTGQELQVAVKSVTVQRVSNESGGIDPIGPDLGRVLPEDVVDARLDAFRNSSRAASRELVGSLAVRWIDKVAGRLGRIAAITIIAAALAHLLAVISRLGVAS